MGSTFFGFALRPEGARQHEAPQAASGRMPVRDGWFSESEVMWPGQAMSLKIEEVLYEGRSDFQDILVFRSATYGMVLALDGVIQLTERDEHAYQEMITHIPMHCHPDPKSVLIVGGGDGGVLREVCRHAGVERITMCEIDPVVCDIAKKFFASSTATAFGDERVTLVHADAAAYVKDKAGEYDVLIVDSSDPVGPAETLFTASFYQSLRAAMKPNAIMCNQGECIWLHLDLIGECMGHCLEVFPTVDYAFTTIPTYPSGQIGFLMCSTMPNAVLRNPVRVPDPELSRKLKYYSSAVHAAAFVLPAFAEKVVASVRRPQLPAVCRRVRLRGGLRVLSVLRLPLTCTRPPAPSSLAPPPRPHLQQPMSPSITSLVPFCSNPLPCPAPLSTHQPRWGMPVLLDAPSHAPRPTTRPTPPVPTSTAAGVPLRLC